VLKLIVWNIARRANAWRCLANSDADIVLLQEAMEPPADVAENLNIDPAPWRAFGRAAIVNLSAAAEVQWHEAKPLAALSREN